MAERSRKGSEAVVDHALRILFGAEERDLRVVHEHGLAQR